MNKGLCGRKHLPVHPSIPEAEESTQRRNCDVMKRSSLISGLQLKFAQRSWNDTLLLVQRCMEKSRIESKPCEPLVRSLERLQDVLHAPCRSVTRSRLEMIAQQQGMGFHVTEDTCYLTADLFYLEVLLPPCGGVQEVKVALHGEGPVPSESFLKTLRSEDFAAFSTRLKDLFTQYNIPGDNEIKLKLLESLQFLVRDLQKMTGEAEDCDPQQQLVNNNRTGCLVAGKEDGLLTVLFYKPPNDVMQTAQVTVGASAVPRRLQMASVLPEPLQLDSQGCPVGAPPSEVPGEMLPACFLLRLKPPVPVLSSFVEKLSLITDVAVAQTDQQWAPLHRLLMAGSQSAEETSDQLDLFTVKVLPDGETQRYVFPGASWDAPEQRATVVEAVSFTHPAQVPALLQLLRHQCAVNALLRSCWASQSAAPASPTGTPSDSQLFEVRPESSTSFSVTFTHPRTHSLAVLLVSVCGPQQITCRTFGAETSEAFLEDHMKNFLSIPATMKMLLSRLETASPPHPKSHPTSAEEDPPALMEVSQNAAVPEDSVSKTEVSPNPSVTSHLCSPVGTFAQQAEL
ncbi:mediator of RNA polymerase II transcription subunit 1 isoform X2 [Oryzias latipes]|uniref:mediator of RNA polymerase II transcription subunit 1 isoform X2 n=1 Tax=Oryzias latipes TaxID=8090 RepID=UPI000CE1CC93|nr:mediator of RNA polymerase II transcription subunit 1 isoform X2 [Oryzias latipes]